jgi:hypothetical protein
MRLWHPGDVLRYAVEAALAIVVIAVGKMVAEAGRRRAGAQ